MPFTHPRTRRSLKVCLLALSAVLTCLTSSVVHDAHAQPPVYTDIAGSYAQRQILALSEQGVMHGFPGGRFEPNRHLTRGQLLAYLMNLLEPITDVHPTPGPTIFSDVTPGNWDFNYVQGAWQAGWLVPNWLNIRVGGSFHENDEASRGDAASLFVAALLHSRSLPSLPTGESPLAFAQDNDLFSGIPSGTQRTYLTRAGAAVVLANMQAYIAAHDAATAATAEGEGSNPTPAKLVIGWNYGASVPQFVQQDRDAPTIGTYVYDGLLLTPRGFTGAPGPTYAAAMAKVHKSAWALFGNADDTSLTNTMLGTATRRSLLVQSILRVCQTDGFCGANIDFEDMSASDRAPFTAFVEALSAQASADGIAVTVDVPPPSAGSWAAAYDYAALGRTTKAVVVMMYDEHWSSDPVAGPVTSYGWAQSNLDALRKLIPANRLVLGLPLYTRAWRLSGSGPQTQSIPIEQMEAWVAHDLVLRAYDARAGQWRDVASIGNTRLEFWQDGIHTLNNVATLAVQDGLAGYAFWQLGFESPGTLNSILS
ncbi:MAG: glycosyl hydrolase family 18 protein [Firmicutes bacterium]|nr:glycosyl hydrolase family 18 protein [Bacillota bacterium]